MKTINIKTVVMSVASLALFFSAGCTDVLNRPPLTEENDETYWTGEEKVRLYATGFYPRYFVGYNTGYTATGAAHVGYEFSDDIATVGAQSAFELSVPNSRGEAPENGSETVTSLPWISSFTGPNWYFGYVRRANIMLDRVENRMSNILTEEQKEHWSGVARFFRAMDYAQLVEVFGDVPYFDREVGSAELDELYKPRTPRNEVMDAVYDDFEYAMEYVRTDDGVLNINRYVVAAYVSRYALVEGTWQKYHYNNTERAQKFLNLAVTAANLVMSSGRYDIEMEFRDLFTSKNLAGKKDVIMYRHYDAAMSVTHSVASYSNLVGGRDPNPNLALIKAFICSDGSDWQTSADANNKDFTMANVIATRDPRFEASFYHKVVDKAHSTCLYMAKFITREGISSEGANTPAEFTGSSNDTDYPVMRYAEVLLNWIEAKAELATLGGTAVNQSDINASINKLRNRPIAAAAAAMGVKKTVAMDITALPNSPDRGDVSQLIWEIRRERRMEFAKEHSRALDLRRWKKLEYMDHTQNPDILKGAWIDAVGDNLTGLLDPADIGRTAVTDINGNVIVYDGTNAARMVGFFSHTNVRPRQPFLNIPGVNPYLAPVGTNQRINYQQKGYDLQQTEGWSTTLPSGL